MAALQKPLPWHEHLWSEWLGQLQSGRLPHAILLTGAVGLGKRQLAQALAQTLLCSSADLSARPCGHCKACDLIAADSHPDLKLVEPEAPGKAIRVDQVRELVGFLSTTAQQGGWKCIILTPADAMNTQAANALLKSLEEPPSNTLILLVSSNPGRLLPTLRSRCRLALVKVPPRALAIDWLAPQIGSEVEDLLDYAQGAPCAALAAAEAGAIEQHRQIEDALLTLGTGQAGTEEVVKRFLANPALQTIDDMLIILSRLARAQGRADWTETRAEWQSLLPGWDRRFLFYFRDKVLQAKQQLLSGANPNPQLLWEDLLISWQLMARSRSAR